MSIELRQLHYLKVCAETSSFTRAAAALYTSQSNVSKVIRSLEEEIGFPLFERRQYGIALTKAGERIYSYALATLDSAARITAFAGMGQIEELKISANPGAWLARMFAAYYSAYGDRSVHYSYITAGTDEIINRLSARQDQIGFIYVMEEQIPFLRGRLAQSHIYFTPLTRTQAVLHLGVGANAESIADIDLVQGYEDEFALRSYWDEHREHKNGDKMHRTAVTTNSDYVMSELIAHTHLGNISGGSPGQGVCQFGEEIEHGGTDINLYPDEKPVILGVLARDDRQLDSLAVQFLKYIRQEIASAESVE